MKRILLILALFIPQVRGAAYVSLGKMNTYQTIAQMAANHNPLSAEKGITVLGGTVAGDGLGGVYFPTNTISGTNTTTLIASALNGSYSFARVGELATTFSLYSTSVSAIQLGCTGDGSANDTTALASAMTNAAARGAVLDLMGGVYSITNLALDRAVTIRNGTLKARVTYTNLVGFLQVTGSRVTLENVIIDGNSLALRGIRLVDGSQRFRVIGGEIKNMLQPSGLQAQAAGALIEGNTESTFNGVTFSNIVAVANSIVGDDAGCARGIVVARQGTEAVAQCEILNCKFIDIAPSEDADAIAVHQFGTLDVPVNILNCTFYRIGKRWVKILANGVHIDQLSGTNLQTQTNFYAAVSAYGSRASIAHVTIPSGWYSYGVEAVYNASAIRDITIMGCQIGTGNIFTNINPDNEGIKISGGASSIMNVTVIGNIVTNALLGLHLPGSVTNCQVLGNILHGTDSAIYDGDKYVAEGSYGTNQFVTYSGNYCYSSAGNGLLLKRSMNVTLGVNSLNAATPLSLTLAWQSTFRAGNFYNQNHYGGMVTNLGGLHVGNTAGFTVGGENPDILVYDSGGTNVMAVLRFADGTYNRVGYWRVDTNGVSFETSQSSGGNGALTFRMGGSSVAAWDASGNLTGNGAAFSSLTVAGSSVTSPTIYIQTSDVTVANTTTETTLLGTVTGSKTLAVNYFTAGKSIQGKLRGRYSSAAIAGTLRIKVKLGSTIICDTGAQTMPNASANKLFDVDFDITCRTTGASGTVWGQGKVVIGDVTGLVPQVLPMVNTATVTVDTTATQAINVTATWGTADAGNTVTASIATADQE